MAWDVITLGEVVERDAVVIEIRCWAAISGATACGDGPGAAMGHVLHALVGDCPKRDASQLQDRCDPLLPRSFAAVPRARAGLSRSVLAGERVWGGLPRENAPTFLDQSPASGNLLPQLVLYARTPDKLPGGAKSDLARCHLTINAI
jgi:hypothetical protein